MQTKTQPRGVTLVEVAVSTVLVAVVLVASLETLGGSMRTVRHTTAQIDTHTLLEQMMAEALSLPLEDPDGNTSGLRIEADEADPPASRESFDDLDDFADHTSSPPEHRDGTPIAGYDGWQQAWRVDYASSEANGVGVVANTASDEGLRRVVVELTDPDGETVRCYAFRSRYGPADTPAPFDAERVMAVEVSIATGNAGEVTRSAASTNLAELP